MPKVSICIPAYNQPDHLKKTIDSVLRQTYTDYEIVVTDDSPGTVVSELIATYQLPGTLKYYKNNSTLGSPENWNESIRKSSGEYIKILHHDDWLNYDDSLAKYVQLLDDNPGADFAFSATQAIFPMGDDWVHSIAADEVKLLKENPITLYNNNIVGAPSTTIIRRNPRLWFDQKLKWHVDIEYYIRQISANANILYSPELLVVTFLPEGRVSDECKGNKEVEVFEYFYLLDKMLSTKNSYDKAAVKKCLLRTIAVCNTFQIKSLQDIKNCGYEGTIHPIIKIWLTAKRMSPLLEKIFLKLYRNI